MAGRLSHTCNKTERVQNATTTRQSTHTGLHRQPCWDLAPALHRPDLDLLELIRNQYQRVVVDCTMPLAEPDNEIVTPLAQNKRCTGRYLKGNLNLAIGVRHCTPFLCGLFKSTALCTPDECHQKRQRAMHLRAQSSSTRNKTCTQERRRRQQQTNLSSHGCALQVKSSNQVNARWTEEGNQTTTRTRTRTRTTNNWSINIEQ